MMLPNAKGPLIISGVGCKNCRFASKLQGTDNLECRWGPPTTIAMMGAGGITMMSAFPPVGPEISCGRHERGLPSEPGMWRPRETAKETLAS